MELVMKTKSFRDAEREQTSILAPLERAALRGLARHMPGWVNSDHLSVLGLVGMLGAGACYAASKQNPLMLHLVNLFIFLNWFGDSLDAGNQLVFSSLCARHIQALPMENGPH